MDEDCACFSVTACCDAAAYARGRAPFVVSVIEHGEGCEVVEGGGRDGRARHVLDVSTLRVSTCHRIVRLARKLRKGWRWRRHLLGGPKRRTYSTEVRTVKVQMLYSSTVEYMDLMLYAGDEPMGSLFLAVNRIVNKKVP